MKISKSNKVRKSSLPTENDLKNIGDALSKLIQVRYIWIVNHLCRGLILHQLDNITGLLTKHQTYYFSNEEKKAGKEPIQVNLYLGLLRKENIKMAYSDNPNERSYDYNFVRETTLIGNRRAILMEMQAHLEYHKIKEIFIKNDLSCEILEFIRQSRNIICHANSIMSSWNLKRCVWHGIVIEKNNQPLKLTDQNIHDLITEVIEILARLYVEGGKEIDYVSLNMGYDIPYINKYIRKFKK
ncbi:MAG: hypothetical protein KKA79_03810 [Nanoarchaeota archaeon]|nr:hypothetical protein [Nanoarchaeota archaeon]